MHSETGQHPIGLKNIERPIPQYDMNAFDSLDDVSQAGNESIHSV
jgi:hypothetical protein